jgi:elongation factor 3
MGSNIQEVKQEEETGEDLCNCEFSLAYGGKILLNQARLHLRRGQRYGLCGANGTGKSTLLRAIANGQLDGFPSKDEVRTAVVEHDLDGSLSDMSCFEYIMSTDGMQCDKEEVVRVMEDVGFGAKRRAMSIFALSGGWKMKLALARAILMKADILLLDEPTNHLDVTNVAWLADHLNAQHNVTSLIVSHDTAFLDKVCSAIVHYEGFKLKKYLGNLTEFVKIHPEAKSYYTLTDSIAEFSFPAPGLLEGINSKGAPFMKMNNVTFTYKGAETPSIENASVLCSLSSRVGCVGPNGAGKSTLVKVLMGELVPQTGTVWKHPNLRAAYVAQHAFHHLEEHLDKTPSEYIQWRFRSGDDHEAMNKEALALTEAEEKAIAAKIQVDGGKFVVEKIMGRIKEKGVMMYEVKFVDCEIDKNKWVPRMWFTERGISKMVDVYDAQKAAEEGLLARPLTAKNIVKHLQDVGLDEEFTLHSRIRGLSGGQKVKVVIGAAMWMNPHLVVLDEPTNYLDRESLGALSKAINKYEGGVVIISHNSEFTKSVCTEHWYVNDGKLRLEGNNIKNVVKIDKPLVADTVTDAAGNVIKIKQKREYTQKEIKEKLKWHKEKQKRASKGEDVSDDDEVLVEMDLI